MIRSLGIFARCIVVLMACVICSCRSADIRVALLTDLHISPGDENDEVFDKVIDEINQSKFDIVVVAGDMTNTGSNAELQNVYSKLSRLCHRQIVTTGNHETTWSESADTEFLRLWGHNGCSSATVGDYCFVAYPAGPYMKMADGGIRTETLDWIDKTMNRYRSRRLVNVCHYPLNNDLTNREDVISLVKPHGVVASLCGHYHSPRLMNFDSIPGILGRSLMLKRGDERTFGYTILQFDKDSIHVYKKLLGSDKQKLYALHQVEDSQINALPCDPPIASLYDTNLGADFILKDRASIYTGIATSEDVIYYGNSLGEFKAYDTTSKRDVWQQKVSDPIYSTPIIYNDKVLVATVSDGLCAFDKHNGKLTWRNRDCHTMIGDGTICDGCLYIGASGTMMKVDAESGKTMWAFNYGTAQPQGRPTVAENRVVFGAWDRNLYCVDATSGTLIWKWDNGHANVLFSPGHIVPRIANGRVMIVAPDRYMTFIDLYSGKEIWRAKVRRVRETTGLSDDGQTFYAKTMDGDMVAIPALANEYEERWCADAGWGYDHNFCPILTRDGYAYMANRCGEVAAIKESDGVVVGKAKLGNSSINDFTKDENGNIYLSLIEGTIFCIPKH